MGSIIDLTTASLCSVVFNAVLYLRSQLHKPLPSLPRRLNGVSSNAQGEIQSPRMLGRIAKKWS